MTIPKATIINSNIINYSALYDGNQNTIPEDYLSKDYPAPGVEVNPVGKIFNQPFNLDNERE